MDRHFDCLIIGAGICGIDAAYHLKKYSPWAKFAILEGRSNLGGTWDLFKYPGLRSDSDMYTYSYSWKVWKAPKMIADGKEILDYLKEAADEEGITDKIIFDAKVKKADWSSMDNKWHLEMGNGDALTCNVLIGCTGYYSYDKPFEPQFPGKEKFGGEIVHAQNYQSHHDDKLANKKVVIVGSGASAITIFPVVAKTAEHVTMVQRTPSYVASFPEIDKSAKFINEKCPRFVVNWINM